jgi:hypothetical protein
LPAAPDLGQAARRMRSLKFNNNLTLVDLGATLCSSR